MSPGSERRLHCYGSPTTFSPAGCAQCPDFKPCATQSLARVRAYAKHAPLHDLICFLEGELRRAGALPPIGINDPHAATNQDPVAMTVAVAQRNFDKVKRSNLTDDEERFLASVPVKVRATVRPMLKDGSWWQIKSTLAQSRNPFPADDKPYLHVAVNALFQDGGVSKAELSALYQTKFKWTSGTAASRVSKVVRILLAAEVIEDINDRLTLRRELKTTM